MTLENIIEMEGTIIKKEKFNNIIQTNLVAFFQNCGASGLKIGYNWYILNLIDGNEVNVYCETI